MQIALGMVLTSMFYPPAFSMSRLEIAKIISRILTFRFQNNMIGKKTKRNKIIEEKNKMKEKYNRIEIENAAKLKPLHI